MIANSPQRKRRTIGAVEFSRAALRPGKRPFFEAKANAQQIDKLIELLNICVRSKNREWYTLTATHEKPQRLRVTEIPPPEFESEASQFYYRSPLRVSGNAGSVNVDFSGSLAGPIVIQLIQQARDQMKEYIEMRIPRQKTSLIEFIPDTELESIEASELRSLGVAGDQLAAEAWGTENFSDWENAGA